MLGDRIKELRKEVDLTQEDFACQFKLSKSHISKIESNVANPSALVVSSICDFFDVNEKWLLTGEGEKYVERKKHVFAPKAPSPEKTTACYAYKYYTIACMLKRSCNLDLEWDGHFLDDFSEMVLNFIVSELINLKRDDSISQEILASRLSEAFPHFKEYKNLWGKATYTERKNKLDLQGTSLFVSDLVSYTQCLMDDDSGVTADERAQYEANLMEHRYFSYESDENRIKMQKRE